MNFGDSPNRSEEGTATYVTYMEGKTSLAVSGEPLAAISEGVNYGTFSVRCGEELSYSAAAYGYDPENPGNVRYSLAGWTLTDKDGATAASGTPKRLPFSAALSVFLTRRSIYVKNSGARSRNTS